MNGPYAETMLKVRAACAEVFARVDRWFDQPAAVRSYRPVGGRWSIDQVLEHVTLTNHFLLLIIRKGRDRCIKRAASTGLPASGESDLEKLEVIGERGSFHWPRPAHMEPAGTLSTADVRTRLKEQVAECLAILDQLSGGAGALCTVGMSVNKSGKLDMYQYLYFVAQHARRHLAQMEANVAEYRKGMALGT